jgi:hypothetical protein
MCSGAALRRRCGKMLKLILAVIGFSLLCGTTPTLAKQSCEDWCQNRCAHRVLSQGRDPPRLVTAEQLGSTSPARHDSSPPNRLSAAL